MMNNQDNKIKDDAQKFIYVMNKDVADYLIERNFTLLSNNNGNYIFLNNGKLNFDEGNSEEKQKILSKIAYTNVLCF